MLVAFFDESFFDKLGIIDIASNIYNNLGK